MQQIPKCTLVHSYVDTAYVLDKCSIMYVGKKN